MGNDDLTLEVLKQIRDELKSHGTKLDEVRTDLGGKLDRTNERLDRVVQEQIRHATAIVGLEGRMGEVVTELREVRGELKQLNARVDNVLTGQVGATVRETAARVDKLEERMNVVERR